MRHAKAPKEKNFLNEVHIALSVKMADSTLATGSLNAGPITGA